MIRFLLILCSLPAIFCCEVSQAAIEPACWFGDHMVLQREMQLPVWGWAAPGEKVTVELAGHTAKTTAGPDGYWKAILPPQKPGGPHDLTLRGSTETKVIKDVLIGDVWICGGQSNMWQPFLKPTSQKPPEEWEMTPGPDLAHFPTGGQDQIRLYHVGHNGSANPVRDIPRRPTWGPFERTRMNRDIAPESWRVCTPENLKNFSRLGYFFGDAIHREVGVPIGLISIAMGSTSVNQWTSPEVLDKLLGRTPAPTEPVRFKAKDGDKYSDLFNGLVHPLIGLAIKGFIWWQGENDAIDKPEFDIEAYPRGTFREMIGDYRRRWGQGDFPFLFVQLQNHSPKGRGMNVRDFQMQALELPNTGMVVTVDIASGLHPLNKYDISRRLTQVAMSLAYGSKTPFSGPIYRSASVEGNTIRVAFQHARGGLKVGTGLFNKTAEPLSRADDPKAPFEICGADGKWVPADAQIDGETVVVSAPGVSEPRFAAYAMSRSNPDNTVLKTTLFNAEGLPASPFDTRTWPGLGRE